MSAHRDELHHLIDSLPDEQVGPVAAELRSRFSVGDSENPWPPEFFNIVDGAAVPADAAQNVDLYLATYGLGCDSA